jgi:hypothetical protein
MSWAEHVLKLDPSLAPTTRRLVDTVGRYFCTSASGSCQFYDNEIAALMGASSAEVRSARYELERKKFLAELPRPGNGKPRYALHFGNTNRDDDDRAA